MALTEQFPKVEPSPLWLLTRTAAIVSLLYFVGLGVYRLYFHPAAKIPGPLLARLTFWYEFYYDVILTGQYMWKIRELHDKYGPIVRINPEEIHILDAEYYDQVYAGAGRKRDKWSYFTNQSSVQQSVFMTQKHDLHRIRRAALNPYFSKAKIRSLQPRIEEVLRKLLTRFEQFQATKEPMALSLAYAALSNDIVMEYAFARNDNRVSAPDFGPCFKEVSSGGARIRHFAKHFPSLLSLLKMLPESVQMSLNPELCTLINLDKDIMKHVSHIYTHRNNPDEKVKSQTTIFHEILHSNLPEHEKSPDRLWQDGRTAVLAGTLTTATTLSEITYYLLSQPEELRKLKEEIRTVITDTTDIPRMEKLEQLPYLSAIVKEGLRLNNGASARLQRIAPEETLVYTAKIRTRTDNVEEKQYLIRPGTPISITGLSVHHSAEYFKDPMTFRPQRWLDNPGLDKYWIPFSRGARQCIGINLAYSEIYLSLAVIFSQYGSKEVRFPGDKGWLELYDTTYYKDMEVIGDGLSPLYRPESQRVRVLVRP